MMKKLMFLTCSFGIFFVPGQKLALADGVCGTEFLTSGSLCVKVQQIPWVVVGNGWNSILKIANVHPASTLLKGAKQCQIQVGFKTVPLVPYPDASTTNHLNVFFTDNHAPNPINTQLGETAFETLNPDGSVQFTLLTSDAGPGVLALGSVFVFSQATDPACLKGLVQAQLRFVQTAPDGTVIANGTANEQAPSTRWIMPTSVSVASRASAPNTAMDPSVAIGYPGNFLLSAQNPSTVTVRLTLVDENGVKVVATGDLGNDIQINNYSTKGIVIRSLFGANMFPGGKDFSGDIIIEVIGVSPASIPMANAGIDVAAFGFVGSSFGSIATHSIQ